MAPPNTRSQIYGKVTNASTPPLPSPRLQAAENIDYLIDKHFNKKLEELTNKITPRITTQLTSIIAEEIAKAVNDIKEFVNAELLAIKSDMISIKQSQADELHALKHELSILKDKVARQENTGVARNLSISNIPFIEHEDPKQLFNKLCEIINIDVPPLEGIYRQRSNSARSDAKIIVKFKSASHRNDVLRAVSLFCRSNEKKLHLELLGFDSTAPFYVHECLTLQNYNILKLALRLKKEKKLFHVFTRHGLVHVRRSQQGRIIQIDNRPKEIELNKLKSGEESQLFR